MSHVPTVILPDLPCTTCGYNLRHLPADGPCPECTNPVAQTLAETSRRWSPLYLRRLARSLVSIAWLSIIILVECIGGLFTVRFTARASDPVRPTTEYWALFIVTAIYLALIGILALQLWVASADPPGITLRGRTRILRSGIVMMILAVTAMAALQLLEALACRTEIDDPTADKAEALLQSLNACRPLVPLLMMGISIIALQLARRLHDIDRRSGNTPLGTTIRKRLCAFAVTYFVWMLLYVVAATLVLFIPPQDQADFRAFVLIVGMPALGLACIAILTWILTLTALFQFSRRLLRVASNAQTINGQLTGPAPATPTAP